MEGEHYALGKVCSKYGDILLKIFKFSLFFDPAKTVAYLLQKLIY